MRYDLSANTVRVYKSRLRRLMRILPAVVNEKDREAFAREIVDLETKLGVSGDEIINDRPGPKSFRGDSSKYMVDVTTNSEVQASQASLDRIMELATRGKDTPDKKGELLSPNAIQTRRSIIQGYISDMATASAEQRGELKRKALELDERLPSKYSMKKQIEDGSIGWTKEDLDKRAKENIEKFGTLSEEAQKQLAGEITEEDCKRLQAEEEFINDPKRGVR